MKKAISIVLVALFVLCTFVACSNGGVKIAPVSNIVFENGVVSFDKAEGATSYDIVIKHRGETVYEDSVTDTSIDIDSIGVAGNLTISIVACNGKAKSDAVEYPFTVLSTFGNVELEAEDYLTNFGTGKAGSNFRNNPLAHKGAYVGGIDDAGQGVYINYLCPVAGTFDFTVYYCHEGAGAHQDMWVNGEYQTRIDYTKNTGWGGSRFDAANTTVKITLVKGWNTISIMKNGDASDNWGDYAELDYFVIHGDGSEYNVDDLAQYGETPAYYRLEAEMGSPRCKNKVSNMYQCKNPPIAQADGFVYSNGFIIGNIESNYDGVEWQFNSPVKAKYQVKIAYASGSFDGSQPARPSFIVTQKEVGLAKGVDFNDMTKVTFDALPYTGWGNVAVAEQTIEIVLEAGKNFIYCLKLDSVDCGIFQLDYIDISFVEEVA